MIAAFVWVPLWMLSSGTLMGPGELSGNLAPVLESGDGFAAWPIFARYPTFQAYAELLFDTPQFLMYSGIPVNRSFPLYWAILFWALLRHGHLHVLTFAEKSVLHLIYCPYADAFSSDYGFQLSGFE